MWRTLLEPAETNARAKLRLPDQTPTTRKTSWGNAVHPPLALTPNLLAQTQALIVAEWTRPDREVQGNYSADILRDGKTDPPPGPWLQWRDIGSVNSGWTDELVFRFDAFRTQLRLTGITFAEDPAHPESWLRDVRIQWWDTENEVWHDGPMLLSNEALHSHVFAQPLEAARFRLAGTGGGSWPVGNIRLGEVVFHGEMLGCSHRDVLAKRSRATLFDERIGDLKTLQNAFNPWFGFRQGGAYSGSTCLELSQAGEAHPLYRGATFGHSVPDWDFTIAENPAPGQYRWLQFAWKATSSSTTGMGIRVGNPWDGPAYCAFVGDSTWPDTSVLAARRDPGPVPTEWTKVRIDLWALCGGKPVPIRNIGLRADGGGALFDQIVLGRTEADLP
ncbi:MAG TPA: hypothetical protein VJX66_05515 [Amycolatopsis sp.]|nr:hypothetical protein [Amycolatopsis sp.]